VKFKGHFATLLVNSLLITWRSYMPYFMVIVLCFLTEIYSCIWPATVWYSKVISWEIISHWTWWLFQCHC